jgi:alkylation response protein AidB-like acyl-CoA dehydrogenase
MTDQPSISTTHERLHLPATLETELLAEAPAAERSGRMTERQLEIVRQAGWFRMFVPKEYGGLQLPLPQALAVEEALAAIDGSLGWTVTLCSGAGLFAGFVGPELRELMFRNEALCIGGSGAPTGKAEVVDGGYVVNGDWHYATGAPHLTAFSTNCRITKDGEPVKDGDGTEMIRSFLFLPDELRWRENWNVMGLQATASHSFSIENLRVPEWRSFLIRPETAQVADPVYQYPFLQFAELTLAANFGGMALAFLECFEQGLSAHRGDGKRKSLRIDMLHTAKEELNALLLAFHTTAATTWEMMLGNGSIPADSLAAISAVSRGLAAGVRRIVTELFPYAGISAAAPDSRMNRIWRDLFTATQHSLLNYPD